MDLRCPEHWHPNSEAKFEMKMTKFCDGLMGQEIFFYGVVKLEDGSKYSRITF